MPAGVGICCTDYQSEGSSDRGLWAKWDKENQRVHGCTGMVEPPCGVRLWTRGPPSLLLHCPRPWVQASSTGSCEFMCLYVYMCARVHVCVSVCVLSLCIYMSMSVYICFGVCLQVHLCLPQCVCVSQSVLVCTFRCACVQGFSGLCVSRYMCLCVHVSVCVHMKEGQGRACSLVSWEQSPRAGAQGRARLGLGKAFPASDEAEQKQKLESTAGSASPAQNRFHLNQHCPLPWGWGRLSRRRHCGGGAGAN